MSTETTKKDTWVQIHSVVLSPKERSDRIPEDTKNVPLEMWVNGFLLNETAHIGDEVEIETIIGRRVSGTLSSSQPGYNHSFGETLPELSKIGRQLSRLVKGERRNG